MLGSMFQLDNNINKRDNSRIPKTMLKFMILLDKRGMAGYNEVIDDIQ